jgi:hypothetical protein
MVQSQPPIHRRPDAIRIVPLHVDPELLSAITTPPPNPHLTYRKGPLLTSVEVITIFWGAAWKQSPLRDVATRLNQFFDAILVSSLVDVLAEYSVAGKSIGHGARTGTVTFDASEPTSVVTDADIRSLLQTNTAPGGAFPSPTANSLYFLYLPAGVPVSSGGGRSCLAFCGYHDSIDTGPFYAVMPYPNCSGCLGGMTSFDALTVTSSHELCEAITDPVPGTGWYDDTHGEIGDICAWQTKTVTGYTVQQEWSNSRNACS